jgi:hypothetical protein
MQNQLKQVRENIVIAALEQLASYQQIACPSCLLDAIADNQSNPRIRSLMASIALYRLPEAANDAGCRVVMEDSYEPH